MIDLICVSNFDGHFCDSNTSLGIHILKCLFDYVSYFLQDKKNRVLHYNNIHIGLELVGLKILKDVLEQPLELELRRNIHL